MANGVIVVDKPTGISSSQAVQRMRRIAKERRIGHLGTLDPLATGVLPLVIGRATRLSQFFHGHDRAYETTVRCGFSTSTYDRDGHPTSETRLVELERSRLEDLLNEFRGEVLQTPPPVSAKKIDGVRAYKLARARKPVCLQPVPVHFYRISLLDLGSDHFRLEVRCGSGGYIRSLAHDLGVRLGVGAHVETLRRTAVGEFSLKGAFSLEKLAKLAADGELEEAIIPAAKLLPELPGYRVDDEAAARIAHGRGFRIRTFSMQPAPSRIKALNAAGELIAIGELRMPWAYHPIIVF